MNRDGHEVEIELTLSNVLADGEELLIGSLRDMRERIELQRQTTLAQYLKVTAQLASRLGDQVDLDAILQTVVQTLAGDLNAALAQVWLVDPSDGSLALRATAGTRPGPFPDARIDPESDSGEVGRAAQQREPVVVSRNWLAQGRTGTIAAFPLVSGGDLRGVLVFGSSLSLDGEVLDALSALSAIVAAAINDNLVLNREQAARLEAEDERRRLQAILDTVSAGVLLAEGPEGQITVLNPAGNHLLGLDPLPRNFEELLDRFPVERLDGRLIPTQERPLWRSVKLGEQAGGTVRYRRQDGREVILDLNTAPYPGPSGGAVSTFSDVTERFRLEAELADRAAQFKALLDHLPVGVAYFDRVGVCRASNGPARRILGRSRKEITGSTASELFARAPKLREALLRCIHQRAPHAEDGVPWVEDSTRYLDWRFEPLPASDPVKSSRGALALIVDATESALARFALQRTVEAAETASRRKTQFLSAVSHDLRTPVNALSLQAELLARLIEIRDDDDPEMTQLATDIRTVAANLIELINDLLDLTRFDSGMVDFHPSEFPLDTWLERTLAPLEASAHSKGLDFTWRVDRPGRMLRGDKVKLSRVLINLVSNAVKFTDSGRVDITVRATPDGGLILVVRDTGSGIPEDQLERVFDEFAQLRNPERDRTKGTGLGLAICRRLVEGVGGRLTVESRVGEGSTFTARYPHDHVSTDIAAPAPAQMPQVPQNPQVTAPILIVEDDPNSRQALSRLLKQAGYTVETASDGFEALAALERIRPALVLLDLMMPGLEGGEVLRRIRKTPAWQELKVVLLTGDVLSGRTSDLMALNVDGILAKPVDFGQLLEIVVRLTQRTS